MKLDKGFSLFEVLLSLMLILTLGLALLERQLYLHQLIQQDINRAKSLHSSGNKKERGYSLLEVLFGLFLSSIMMLSFTQMYLATKRHYLHTQHLLESSLELQWVRDWLSHSIRSAGFTPCMSIDNLETIDMRNKSRKFKALEIQNSPQPLIQSNRMKERFNELKYMLSSNQMMISKTIKVHENKPLLIADCEHAEVHQILNAVDLKTQSLLTLTQPLKYSYTPPTYIGEWLEEKWFIKLNSIGVKSLYHKITQSEEVTPLIRDMRIKKQSKQLIDIELVLDKKEKHQLLVAVRGK